MDEELMHEAGEEVTPEYVEPEDFSGAGDVVGEANDR